jgi:hypothetical protein
MYNVGNINNYINIPSSQILDLNKIKLRHISLYEADLSMSFQCSTFILKYLSSSRTAVFKYTWRP